jgi:hypothetical protein
VTAQIPDRIRYNGESYQLFSNPLHMYLSDNFHAPKFVMPHTACWRGYVARWEIIDDNLNLTSISGTVCRRRFEGDAPKKARCKQRHRGECEVTSVDMAELFPDNSGKVFAEWFTGELKIPNGIMKDYVHMGYLSQFERYLRFTISQGKMTEVRIDS